MKWWLMLVLLALALGGGYLAFAPEAPKEEALVVNMRTVPIRTDLTPGQLLTYDVAVRTTKQTQVRVVSDLFSQEKKQSYFSIPDIFTFSKNVTKRYKISLPSAVVPGNYELRVLLTYGEKKILATAPVRVRQVERAPIIARPPSNVTPKAVNLTVQNQTLPTATITPTLLEVPPDIKATCPEEQLDSCVLEAAIGRDQSGLCNAIQEQNTRDNCYIHFIENGEIALCDRVAFPEFKEYCEALQSSGIPAQALPEAAYTIETIEGSVD
ncbi:hypothetical protein HY641_03455 [Candidatus Woesearchaeota archaeon]|nr:hypothetical protein [Candidatus Woesearchaeota archaeon]